MKTFAAVCKSANLKKTKQTHYTVLNLPKRHLYCEIRPDKNDSNLREIISIHVSLRSKTAKTL